MTLRFHLKWENVALEQGKSWVLSIDHKSQTSRGVSLNSVALKVSQESAIYFIRCHHMYLITEVNLFRVRKMDSVELVSEQN